MNHTGAGKADVNTRPQRDSPPTLSALPSRIKDRLLALSSICIFRFLLLLMVLAEVVKLIGILYEGCKIWYLIAGHGTFQVPTFSCPQHQQSIRYDAAELLHDWLCGAEDSAGEATARALALTLATVATSSSLAAAAAASSSLVILGIAKPIIAYLSQANVERPLINAALMMLIVLRHNCYLPKVL